MSHDRTAAAIETHLSTLLLTSDRVFKLLKPLDLGFVDHRSVQQRRVALAREFERNHAYSPSVYLDVVDLTENGEITDSMMIMRRLDETESMQHLASNGELTPDHLRAVARRVAAVHEASPAVTGRTARQEIARHRRLWDDNLAVLATHAGTLIDTDALERTRRLVDDWLSAHERLLTQRLLDGFVRLTHGDLLAADIYCTGNDGLQVELLDCLAFDDELASIDVLDDLATLAMDIERLTDADTATDLVRWYHEFSNERHPASLLHYYLAYRASVRAKVTALRFEQGDDDSAPLVTRLANVMTGHIESAQTRLILVGGAPGTGKTTLAAAIADALDAVHLSSDDLRKDLAGMGRIEHAPSSLDDGLYSPDRKTATYHELAERGASLLAVGESVVLDASWSSEDERDIARAVARRLGAAPVEIECRLPRAVARERIVRRAADPYNNSDATPELADALAARREPWPTAVPISTDKVVAELTPVALEAIRQAGWRDVTMGDDPTEQFDIPA